MPDMSDQKVTSVSRRTALTAGFALAAAGAAGAAGCGPSGAATSTTARRKVEKSHLNVAVVPAVTNMGLFLAQQHGFFAAEGLHITINPVISSTTAISSQLHGSTDITAGAYVSYILAQANSQGAVSWRILSEGSVSQPHSQEILIRAGSPVRTVSDLTGKKIAANITGNVGQLLIDSMLQQNDMKPSSVTLVEVPFPDMAASLQARRIDAGWFDEPFLSTAQTKLGAQALYDTGTGATANFPISGYMATKAWAQKYPNTAAAFVRAITRGQLLADGNLADDQATVGRYLKGVTPQIAGIITFDAYPAGVSQIRIQRVADVMKQFGLLKQRFDVSGML
jgi:NitT/TauT family transport system substrate-binding protein